MKVEREMDREMEGEGEEEGGDSISFCGSFLGYWGLECRDG